MKFLSELIGIILLILVITHWSEIDHWFSVELHLLTAKAEAASR